MLSVNQISAEYLRNRCATADFLNRRRSFTRELGKDREREARFIEGDSNPDRKLAAFRGIPCLNPARFKTKPLKDFRGIIKNDFDRFVNPDTFVNDGIFDNRQQIESGELEFHRHNPHSAEKIDYGRIREWIYLQQHPEVAEMLAEDRNLRESYDDDALTTDRDIENRIVSLALQRLDHSAPLDELYLKNHPEIAKLIALNIGGAAEIANQNEEIGEALTGSTRKIYSNDLREEFAAETAAKFIEETGLEKDFFTENPEAAIYLKNHPGLIERFNQRPQEGENFKRFYSQLKTTAEEEILRRAGNALRQQGDFIDDYLESDPEFAADVAVSEEMEAENSLADNTMEFEALKDKYTDTRQIYDSHLAAAADNSVDNSTFNREFFKDHPNLGLALVRSPELAQGLREAKDDIDRFFGDDGNGAHRSKIRGAMKAFASSYPLRNSNLVDLWI